MDEATALLGLTDKEFAETFSNDSSVSEWIFGGMKDILQKIESHGNYSEKLAENLLLLAIRVVALEAHAINLQRLVDRGILSLPRIVLMCSLYAPSNHQVMQWWMQKVCERAPIFLDQIPLLHDVFYHALLTVHHQVSSLKSPCLIEATQIETELCNLFQTIHSLSSSSDRFLSILTPVYFDSDLGQSFDGQTLLRAMLVCYERDVPMLSQFGRNEKLIPKIRRFVILIVYQWLETLFLSAIQLNPAIADDRCEQLFGVLNSLLHNPEAVEPMSLLSDLCRLNLFKTKCKSAFENSTVDETRLEYLTLLLSELPARAPPSIKTEVIDETNPNVVLGNSIQDDKQAIVQSIISQVREIFPDLGDGFLELTIQACDYSSDKVIMSLLEDALPEDVAHLDRTLQKNDPRYIAMTETKTAQPKPQQPQKLDSSNIWVGKKKQAEKYVPESVKVDAAYLAKQQQLAQVYDQEPAWQAEVTQIDEYNDDYNDELEEYEPFGVHDDEPTEYEEIIARNKAVLAQEAEDAFWESMRNPNHKNVLKTENDSDNDDNIAINETDTTKTTSQKGAQGQGTRGRGPKGKGSTTKPASASSNEPVDQKKQAQNRARKEQHKSSVANHRRKDKALKKQGGGMF